MSDQQTIEFAAMRGLPTCLAAIRRCEDANGRPLNPNERRRVRIDELEVEEAIRRVRRAQVAAGNRKSVWHRMDDAFDNQPQLRIENNSRTGYRMYCYGDIGAKYNGIVAESFIDELRKIPPSEPVTLHINSEGGGFHDGMSMYEAVRDRGNVDVVVDSLAASAASLIAMGGRTISMSEHAWMMIHLVRGTVQGEADELRRIAKLFDQHNEDIIAVYMRRWNGSETALREALVAETWLDAQQAVQAGLADRVTTRTVVAARVSYPSKYRYDNIPSVLQVSAKSECVSPSTVAAKFKLWKLELEEALDK